MPLISIVDDDLSVRRALRRLLHSAGYDVEAFASGGEFLASPALGRSACLVLDVRLDGMTGFDLHARMAADQIAIPIIFITAHDNAATRERVQDIGAAEYLAKPFDQSALLAAIQKIVTPADTPPA